MPNERRLLFRHGALILLVSAVLGLVVAVQAPHVVKWRDAHVAGLMTGILIIAFGALWTDVHLSDRARRAAITLGLVAAWGGVATNIFGAIVNFPGPASDPGVQPDVVWQMAIFFTGLAIVVPSTLVSFFLVWRGLWGNDPRQVRS
jgi:hydroxylaminobenzene mutase